MRLVTWNCHHGTVEDRLDRLRPLAPDIVSLQEVARPPLPFLDAIWRGSNDAKGIAVASCNPGWAIQRLDFDVPPTALPVTVNAPIPFTLLALWTLPTPSYEEFTLMAVRACGKASTPMVIMGDLNSSPALPARRAAHLDMLRVLREEFGLVSAYHAFHKVAPGEEAHATHYWRWKEDSPWHIDFCFVPEGWVEKIRSVAVGSFAEWADSDHRPLVVDLDL